MKLTNKQLRQIIKEELQRVLQEEEPMMSEDVKALAEKIDNMAEYLGVSSDYSSRVVGEEVIKAAANFISQNEADNVFDTDLGALEPDNVNDFDEDVLGIEDNFNDPDMYGRSSVTQFGLEREDHPHFIFALYAGYYSKEIEE